MQLAQDMQNASFGENSLSLTWDSSKKMPSRSPTLWASEASSGYATHRPLNNERDVHWEAYTRRSGLGVAF